MNAYQYHRALFERWEQPRKYGEMPVAFRVSAHQKQKMLQDWLDAALTKHLPPLLQHCLEQLVLPLHCVRRLVTCQNRQPFDSFLFSHFCCSVVEGGDTHLTWQIFVLCLWREVSGGDAVALFIFKDVVEQWMLLFNFMPFGKPTSAQLS